MAYTSPDPTNINFELKSGYQPPEATAVAAEMLAGYAAPVRRLLEQPYSLAWPVLQRIEQVYGLQLVALCRQLYGNAWLRRAKCDQVWGAALVLRTMLRQRYGDAAALKAVLASPYTLLRGLRNVLDQDWSVAGTGLLAAVLQDWSLQDKDLLRTLVEQLYVLAAGEAVVQNIDISVTIDGSEIKSYHNINEEQDESLYYMTGELQLTDRGDYLACRRLASVVEITVSGEASRYLVEEPRTTRTGSGAAYMVPLVSETILLGHAESELAVAAEQNWSGMRKTLVAELAAPFVVDWRLPNTFLPANILYTNGRSRIDLIREIVRSLGGVVQTSPAGELICRPEYPQSVNTWADAVPDVQLTDQDDLFQITGQPSARPGYDRFFLTNDQVAGDDLRIEIQELSAREQQVQVTPVPFSEMVVLHHSGGDWVQIVADGVIEVAMAEQVEFVEGAGRTSRPVHGSLAVTWRQRDLGEVTASEDGELTAAAAGNSLAWVEYVTRAVQFRVINDRIEDVQVYPEVLA